MGLIENVNLVSASNISIHRRDLFYTAEEESIMHQKMTKIIFCTVYATTSFLGVLGNSLVLFAIARHKSMHTVQNAFFANLSTSHILLCVFSPFTLVYTLMNEWIFGSVACFLVACTQGISFYVSSITLMCIAINRYIVLKYPCRRRPTPQAAVICGIWIVSVLAVVPYGISLRHMPDNNGIFYCEEIWPNELSRRLFGIYSVLSQFIAPFAVIICCYVKISFMGVRNVIETKGIVSQLVVDNEDENKNSNERWQTNRMLIIMATIAGYSLLPLKIVNLLYDVHPQFFDWKYESVCFFIGHALATTSLCCNPILYVRFSSSFQKAFVEMWPFGVIAAHLKKRRESAPESCPVSEAMEILLSESNANTPSNHNKVEIISVPD